MEIAGDAQVGSLFVGVAAADKDLSGDGRITRDKDVWLLNCKFGNVFVNGEKRGKIGMVEPGSVLTVTYDRTRVGFFKDGQLFAEINDVPLPNPVKLIVSMGWEGNAVRLL